jgi:bifunctional UDP-N-acetylglucosamine pyrophosphorylase/glucosamine-1-phosphate N-acetyltransferase
MEPVALPRRRACAGWQRYGIAPAMSQQPATPSAAIILAAGRGTRMRSELHKVLHPIGGRPMLGHVLDAVAALGPERTVVVVGDRAAAVESWLGAGVATAIQSPQLGTGHAVLQARRHLAGFAGTILVLFGDVPLIRAETLARLVATVDQGADIAVLGFRPAQAAAYGRILLDAHGDIARMVEARDATPAELAEPLCNAGMMAVRHDLLFALLDRVGNDNAAAEYYLPDIVMLARADGHRAAVVEAAEEELLGVNSRADLAMAEAAFQRRRRSELMAAGVTLTAPETVFLAFDTIAGPDCCIGANVVFGPGVRLGQGVTIHPFCHVEGAEVADGCEVGPFARLRPGARLERGARVGNFVEVKNGHLGEGAKANHLAYLGDCSVGAGANVGAGTITCNYDGFGKYRTEIGAGAFIGSNTALVAPVRIGEGAIVAAGSVITRDVAAQALALGRGTQTEKAGWAERFRSIMRAKKGQN